MASHRGWLWLLCGVVAALAVATLGDSQASAADVASAPLYGSFGMIAPNPLGFLGSLTIQNGVHDATGTVYVLENLRISKFDRDGHALLSWPCPDCYGLDVNQSTGDVYVTQQNQNSVLQYSSSGTFIRQFGGSGTADANLHRPHGIAVDPTTGNVYVFDTAVGRIKVFSGTGTYLRAFGQPGTGPGDFSGIVSPGGVAFDWVNRWVYVTEPNRYRVLKFAEDGTFLTKWGDPVGQDPGHLRWCRSVEVAGDGTVYVTDTDSERIQYFTPDGTYLGQFQGPHNLEKGPFHPRDIAINRLTGEKYVNAAYAFRQDKFDANNDFLFSFGGKYKDGTFLDAPQGVAAAPNGDVYVLDSGNFMIKRFSAGGAFKAQMGGSATLSATQPGLIGQGTQSALGVEPDSSVWTGVVSVFYASAPPYPWLSRYDANNTVTGSFARKPIAGITYDEQVRDIAIEPATRDLFVADASFNRLKRITQAGVTSIDLPVLEAGGLAFRGGKLYMTDSFMGVVRRYNDQLVQEATLGSPGTGNGQFLFGASSGIAVGADGHIFVADTVNQRIQELAPDGSFIAKRGGVASNALGSFIFPHDVTLSANGDLLYVADTLNHRIQMFCLTTTAACDAIVDPDADGRRDYEDNCPAVANPAQTDGDNDKIGDACDACPTDPSNDVDGDGVCAGVDNCPLVANPDQADSDGNGMGDACDVCPVGQPDLDGDTICGSADNCPFTANPDQLDRGGPGSATSDGVGDVCQCGDLTANGVVDVDDLAAYRAYLTQDPATAVVSPKCRVSIFGSPGCTILDEVVLARALGAGGPIAQACSAATGL